MYVSRGEGGMGVPLIDEVFKMEIIGIMKYLVRKDCKYPKMVLQHENEKTPSTSITKKGRDYLQQFQINDEGEDQVEGNLRAIIAHQKKEYKEKRQCDHIARWRDHNYANCYRLEVLELDYINKEKTVEKRYA